MLSWLRAVTPAWVGLDINPDEIRLLQLKDTRSGWAVTSYAVEPLPVGAISDGKIRQPQIVRTALQNLVRATNTTGSPTAIALPANTVISQQIKLAACLSERQCEKQISHNLERYLPGVNEELCFDFMTTATSDNDYREIRLVASRLEQLRTYAEMVNNAGLQVKVVDVDAYAMMRAAKFSLGETNPNAIVAIVDVGKHVTQLMVFQQQHIIFSQQWQTMDLTQLPKALQRALHLCLANQSQLRIEHVLLSGKISALPLALQNVFQQELALTPTLANPFQAMSLAAVNEDDLQQLATRFQICCGLATRDSNYVRN
jgi:type IV pilus assembly protein PilM